MPYSTYICNSVSIYNMAASAFVYAYVNVNIYINICVYMCVCVYLCVSQTRETIYLNLHTKWQAERLMQCSLLFTTVLSVEECWEEDQRTRGTLSNTENIHCCCCCSRRLLGLTALAFRRRTMGSAIVKWGPSIDFTSQVNNWLNAVIEKYKGENRIITISCLN